MKRRRGPVAEDSLDGGATTRLGQPAGGGLNSPAEVVRELVEVGHDVLPYHPSALIRGHRVELFSSDDLGRVSHLTRVSVTEPLLGHSTARH